MGIPFYFKKLFTIFGKQVLHKVDVGSKCQDLFLDFNCLIHQCANNIISSNPSLSQNEYEVMIVNNIVSELINLVNVVRPIRTLYICIDGLCPKAKMIQQRKRRYMSEWRRSMTITQTHVQQVQVHTQQAHTQQVHTQQTQQQQPDWDSNIITPGSRFMKLLDKSLDEFIQSNLSKFKFDIKLSPSSDPGEGEHKIFEYMKIGSDSVIYGLDADLILLSLISPNCDNIRLLRERPEFMTSKDNSFIFLNIGNLATSIVNHFQIEIKDYVMLCTLLGNDFIPPLSYLNIRDDGIEMVIDAYKKRQVNETLISSSSSNLNTIVLSCILKELARNEDARMGNVCSKYYEESKIKSIDNYPQYAKHLPIINPQCNPNGWREIYYSSLFVGEQQGEQHVICQDYIAALFWVHAYYFKGFESKTWYYPHAYSPLIKDLTVNFDASDYEMLKEKVERTNDELYDALKSKSYLQLLSVLPPSSVNRLYPDFISLQNCNSHMYPTRFKINTFLKTYLWECSPVLPPIDTISLASIKV